MRSTSRSLVFVPLLLAAGAPPAVSPVESLSWMAGCWERRAGFVVTDEHWMSPRAGTMLGTSRTTRGDAVVEYEFMRIYGTREDTVVYAAHPSGQKPAQFRGRAMPRREITFENRAHDFPQRIIYRALGDDSLVARVEGTSRGKSRGVDFRYRRVACTP